MMKNAFIKKIIILSVVVMFAGLMFEGSPLVTFGTTDFFQKHGVLFLIFITLFPRLTLLFSSVSTGGFLWWLSFFFWPRVLVASLATISYYKTNPYLVVMSWIVAIGGETMEKRGIGANQSRFVFKTFRAGEAFRTEPQGDNVRRGPVLTDTNVIEAEFTKKS